jgi:formate dehydrogenase major subunit
MGSNMAECHPVGFRWVMEAKRRGATIIHVDPRFTRTSAMSTLHVPIRAGSDIVFLGGLVRYVMENERFFKDYVLHYTNASAIVSDDFADTEDLDGLFSGWNAETGQYDIDSWQYKDDHDLTLQDPRCVFQIVKRHFSRYTPEMVEDVCGCPKELFLKVAETLAESSGRDKTSALCYAVGWTQHTVGVQYIRTAAIVQLLLGNIGRPGGGILALRGHASIQGSTDIPTLYNLLPGYLPMPKANTDVDLARYIENNESAAGWWSEFPKYIVSLLKAWWGDAATKDNGYCYDYLPQLTGDHSHMTTVADMADGMVKGYFVMGENPTVGSMHGAFHREGMRRAEWVVVRDFAPTETAEFWRDAPEIARGEVRPEDIATEVFFFPCAAHAEKDGTFTNTQRLLQWHEAAIEPAGDCRSELHFMYHLGKRLKKLYASSRKKRDLPIRKLTWDYPTKGPHDEPDAESVLEEVSGYTVADHAPLSGFKELKGDGSTACGCWIYSGCYADGVNQPARRKSYRDQSWVAPEWGWAWPANRRILYNRASADPDGKPWSDRKKYVWWNEAEGSWDGEDVPDFIDDRQPSYRPEEGATGLATISGDDLDGPLPTHYEPQESVVENPIYGQQCNPARMEWDRKENPYHRAHDDPRFPFVITTYRLTEHHTAGGMSRWLSWLSELQPEMFCEVSRDLAVEKDLTNGGWATITTARGEIECRVLVTDRLMPLRVVGRTVHQIGLPYHWGTKGLVTGDAANELVSFVADPNVSIQESKALTGNIEPGRRSKRRRVVTSGPVVEEIVFGEVPRDLPPARHRPEGSHGVKAGEAKEGDQT